MIRARTLVLFVALGLLGTTARAQPAFTPPPSDGAAWWYAPEYEEERLRDRHLYRTAVELSVPLLGGAIWYWVSVNINAQDWRFPLTVEGQYRKLVLGEGYRFDDNDHYLNSPGHPAAGALSFFLARHNGLNPAEALVASTTSSLVWELGIEHREVLGLNDFVLTSFGGAPLGEALFATGSYLRSSQRPAGSLITKAAQALDRFHLWLEGDERSLDEASHQLVFTRGMVGRVDAYTGLLFSPPNRGESRGVGTGWQLGLDSRLLRVPGALQTGRFGRAFADTARTDLRANLALGASGDLLDNRVEATATYLGWYGQYVSQTDAGRARGAGLLVALQSELAHLEHRGAVFDRLARASPVALTVEGLAVWGAARTSLRLDVSPDLATVVPRALVREPDLLVGVATKSVLLKENYYFAVGGSLRAAWRLDWGPVHLFAAATGRAYESVDGLDAEQHAVVDELHGSARRLETEIGGTFDLPLLPAALRVHHERRFQADALGPFEGAGAAQILTATLLARL